MPIMVIRGHQIEVNGAAMDIVRTISRPLARYAFIGSIYMTIVITFERYRGKYFMRFLQNIATVKCESYE
jgi:hypothetical protein